MKTLLTLSFLLPGVLCAQDLIFDGFLKYQDLTLPNMTATLHMGDSLIEKSATTEKGQFKFELAFDHIYTLTFEGPGFATKTIKVDTRYVPQESREFGFEYGGFTINMVPYSKRVQRLLRDRVVARVAYDPANKGFMHDQVHAADMKAKLGELVD